jgi:phosphatidylglycerophosphate synthase
MSSLTKQIPNFLTFSRLVISGIVWWLVIIRINFLAGGLIFLGSMTDLFDGIIARKLKASSRFGYYFDHCVDTIFVASVIFPAWKYLNPNLVLLVIALSCLVILISPAAMTRKKIEWPNVWGKTAFGFLIGSSCVALVGVGLPNIWHPYFSWLGIGNGTLVISIVLRMISFGRFFWEVRKRAKIF